MLTSHEGHDGLIMKLGVIAVITAFAVETGMNALFGYRLFGLGSMLVFSAIAVFGALAGVMARTATGAWRWMFFVVACGCFAASQVAGNAVMLTAMADGGVKRQVQASQGATVREQLAALRAEQAKLGVQRPSREVAPQENLECRRTSQAYKDGVGPRCTELRAELARATRAEALPKLIDDMAKRAGTAPQLVEGEPYLEQLQWVLGHLVGELGLDGLRRGWVVGIVFLLGIIANFGPAMLIGAGGGTGGSSSGPSSHGDVLPASAPSFAASSAFTPPPALFAPSRALPPPLRPLHLPREIAEADIVPAQAAPASAPSSSSSPSHNAVSGAPISFHVNMPGVPSVTTVLAPDHQPAPAVPVEPLRRAGEPPSLAPDLGAGRVDDAPPVDRSVANDLIDRLLAFRQACLVKVASGHVSAEAMYQRYVRWAGERALAEPVFHSTFAAVSGVEMRDVAGQHLYRGVVVREPQLRVAS